VFEENAEEGCVEIFDRKFGGCLAESLLRKMQKQAEGVAVSGYRMRARLALPEKAIAEEGLKKGL
jgi:hypothetical protein